MWSKFGFRTRGDIDVEKAPQVDITPYDNRSNGTPDNLSGGAIPGESFEYGNFPIREDPAPRG